MSDANAHDPPPAADDGTSKSGITDDEAIAAPHDPTLQSPVHTDQEHPEQPAQDTDVETHGGVLGQSDILAGEHTTPPNEPDSAATTSTTYDATVSSPPPPPIPSKDSAASTLSPPPIIVDNDEKQSEEEAWPRAMPPNEDDDRSEIQDIMEQFAGDATGPGEEEIMSPIRERASFFALRSPTRDDGASLKSPSLKRHMSNDSRSPSVAEGGPPLPPPASEKPDYEPMPRSPSIFKSPPPESDPEPDLPFDFHRFLEQLRHRTADPVARFLRSFLNEFGKKQWQVHEQVKIIADFLEFISKKMSQCEVWRSVTDAEFDNAREGVEKLVMNRLYSQTFSPAIPAPDVPSPSKARRKAATAAQDGPGRKGQHQEDVERDDVIAEKIRIYGWIREEHLDIPSIGEKGLKFLTLAQQELQKINSYRAPRDKVIQILNCCKVIFGFLKNNKTDQSADSFVPLLIYTVLRANPAHLVSNLQYILRFRNQDKLGGEAGYYISSLMGVIGFIETLDRTNLTISDQEFERNVEAAVSAIAEGHRAEEYEARTSADTASPGPSTQIPQTASPLIQPQEKSAPCPPAGTPRNSTDATTAERATSLLSSTSSSPRKSRPAKPATSSPDAAAPRTSAAGGTEDLAAGLLRTIGRPLSSIGRMFSDEPPHRRRADSPDKPALGARAATSVPSSRRSVDSQPGGDGDVLRLFGGRRTASASRGVQRGEGEGKQSAAAVEITAHNDGGKDAARAARAASRADAEVERMRSEEYRVVVETLQGMFPDLDREVISDVVRLKEGRVGVAVDACLALSG